MKDKAFFKSDLWVILRSILVLSVIAIVAGALLGYVNHVTQIDENEVINAELKELVTADSFTECSDKIIETSQGEVERVFTPDGVNGTYVYLASGKGYGGDVKLFVVVKDNVVDSISVYEAEETAGLGDTLLKKGEYFKQFVGTDLTDVTVFTANKNASAAGEIVSKTGSTRTSNAVIYALSAVAECHNSIVGGGE